MDFNFTTTQDVHLLKNLYRYLNYELSSALLFILVFTPVGAILIASAILIFTPYMLYVLYKTKKRGWLASFIILIMVPYIALHTIIGPSDYNFIFSAVIMFFFFLFCILLKLALREQLAEISARRQFELRQELKKDDFKNWEQNLNTKL